MPQAFNWIGCNIPYPMESPGFSTNFCVKNFTSQEAIVWKLLTTPISHAKATLHPVVFCPIPKWGTYSAITWEASGKMASSIISVKTIETPVAIAIYGPSTRSTHAKFNFSLKQNPHWIPINNSFEKNKNPSVRLWTLFSCLRWILFWKIVIAL